ncbi:MAG TPA: 1-acyl-sn-glycerol-3-phosphate acyltransferase, partial [Prolixibacteraceae bacterium]|nr:1-acyl-sn-glycerol-3-phosphate acyltransferase [Prolixibacteraceae bacterium]
MSQKSAGYDYLRIYVRFAFWLMHKKIVVKGLDNIPKNQPVIFAVNHQNALMDPMALVCTNPLQTLWLTRADIFKNRAARPVLKFLKMIPIYRIRDGKDSLSNNEQIFQQVTRTLEDKLSIALFPEAAHSGKRQMLPHKKAIPRIALEAEEKNNFELDLQIVPVGIYYDHYWNFDRTLIVQYGEPFDIDSYKERYAENSQNAMITLRDQIHDMLEPLTMQINSVNFYHDYENIRSIAGEEYSKRQFFDTNPILQLFRAEQELITKTELFEAEKPEIFKELVSQTRTYTREIQKGGFTNKQIAQAVHTTWLKLTGMLAISLLSAPLLVFGILFNFIPFLVPSLFFTRKIKDTAFISSFNFALSLIIFPIFYLLVSALIWVLSGSFLLALAAIFAIPFAGKLAYKILMFDIDLIQIVRLRIFGKGIF